MSEFARTKDKKSIAVRGLVLFGALVLIMGVILYVKNMPEKKTIGDVASNVLYLEGYDSEGVAVNSGSGFLIDPEGVLVTNYHVIEDRCRIKVFTSDGEKSVWVDTILAYDPVADLALLKCDKEIGAEALQIAPSDTVKQGDKVYAVGYPLGVANTLSDGIISSRYKNSDGVDILQTTAAISGGSSGGALLNEKGQVVGVIRSSYEGGENMNLAIASDVLKEMLATQFDEISMESLYKRNYPQAGLVDYYACVRTAMITDETHLAALYAASILDSADEEDIIAFLDHYESWQGGGKLHFVEPGMWTEPVDSWCFDPSRKIGDAVILETDYGYTFCYFSDAVKVGSYVKSGLAVIHQAALVEKYEDGRMKRDEYEERMKLLMQADTQKEYQTNIIMYESGF